MSMCKDYVEWFNGQNPAAWPTWTPGDYVQPGDVGFFGREKNFRRYGTIPGAAVTSEISAPARINFDERSFEVSPSAKLVAPVGGHAVAFAGGEIAFTAKRDNASLLQIDEAFECELVDRVAILEWVREMLLIRKWDIDAVLVTRRIRSEAGFARIVAQKGDTVNIVADGEISPARLITLAKMSLGTSVSKERNQLGEWQFNKTSTPIFLDAIRVATKWWARLIPGLGPLTGKEITDHAGHKWNANKPPWNLRHLNVDQRLYDSKRSLMGSDEIMSLQIEDLVEVITHLGVGDSEPPPEDGSNPQDILKGPDWTGATVKLPSRAGEGVVARGPVPA